MQYAIRPGEPPDLPSLTALYNHYVEHSPATFDIERFEVAQRARWFAKFARSGPHRLLVACAAQGVIGYASSQPFRDKRAYETTVESSVYLLPVAVGKGIASALYAALFAALASEDVRCVMAGITLPNEASVALHERHGFELCGVMREVGRKGGRFWDVAWYQRLLGHAIPEPLPHPSPTTR